MTKHQDVVMTKNAGPRCPASVEHREPCRDPPGASSSFCYRHDPNIKRSMELDRERWCTWVLKRQPEGERCQNFALLNSEFCHAHDPKLRAVPKEREARSRLLESLGGNTGALTLLLNAVVSHELITWQRLLNVAQREGLTGHDVRPHWPATLRR